MIARADVWHLSQGNVVEDLLDWKNRYLEMVQGKTTSARTMAIYSGIIDDLVEYSRQFQDEVAISDIGAFYIVRFLEDKAKTAVKGFSDQTRNLYIRVIKTFFKFIEENNIESFSMLYNIRNLKVKRIDPADNKKPAYTGDQVDKIITTMEKIRLKTEKSPKRAITMNRNFIMTKLALYAGLRACEIAKVKYEDLESHTDGDSGQELYRIEIMGKGETKQYTYIVKERIEEELCAMRRIGNAKGLIAISSTGKPLGPVQINHNISRITRQAGMSKQGVHIFRHTYARQLLREGIDTEIVRQLLRHKKIATTVDFYLATDEDAKAAAAARVGHRHNRNKIQNEQSGDIH